MEVCSFQICAGGVHIHNCDLNLQSSHNCDSELLVKDATV